MRYLVLIICVLLHPHDGFAQFVSGLTVDTSSNMLLRPDGDSGVLTSLYGGYQTSLSSALLSYTADAGFIQHYEGIQYHRHNFDAGMPLISSQRGLWTVAVEGTLARYGDVTSLEGYGQYGVASTVKYYLTPHTLLRWEGGVSRREYREYERETYNEYDTFLRLDRFFSFGLTLRGQIDAGIRHFSAFDDAPTTAVAGIRLRAAKSLGEKWGIWAEAYGSDIISTDATSDTAAVYDRLFLDDPYKYSKTGVVLNIKHLISSRGMVQLRSSMLLRRYDGSLNTAFWYLPPDGWEEREASIYLTVSYRPAVVPQMVTPSIDLYYIAVDASEGYLSYRSYGTALSFDF